jgi:hypothetical protein
LSGRGPGDEGGDTGGGEEAGASLSVDDRPSPGSVAWRLLNVLLVIACLLFCSGIALVVWGWHVWDLMPLSFGLMLVVFGFVFGTVLGFVRAAFNVMPPRPSRQRRGVGEPPRRAAGGSPPDAEGRGEEAEAGVNRGR